MKHRDYFNLDPNAPIFSILEEEQALWWKTVCNDKELYINIRKDNRINVYYKGASVMDLKHDPIDGFIAYINDKYINEDNHCKYKKCKDGYLKIKPEDIIDMLESIKRNIFQVQCKKGRKNNPEKISEKEFQGEEYLRGRYIDSEYEFVYSQPKHKRIRIDLISINSDGLIEFIELKRISDGRLLKVEDSKKIPEIIDQIHNYNRFINEYSDDILSYYKRIQQIMKMINIPNYLLNVDIKGVNPNLKLLFIPYADGKAEHPKRRVRVNRITELLKNENTISNINEV